MSLWSLAGLLIGLSSTIAYDGGQQDAPSYRKRMVYVAQHAAAKDLERILSQHFSSTAVNVLPAPNGNALLISANTNEFDEVLNILRELDHHPRTVRVELWIAVTTHNKPISPSLEKTQKEAYEKQFSGPTEEVIANIEALKQNAQIAEFKHLQFTALENQPISIQLNESKPYVSGINILGPQNRTNNIAFQSVGTTVEATVAVIRDDLVSLDLRLEDTRNHTPDDGVQIGVAENGTPIRVPEMTLSKLSTKLTIRSGIAALAHGVKTTSRSNSSQTMIIVSAQVLSAEDATKKDTKQ